MASLRRVRQAVSVPLIGIGGIMTAEDVLEFLVVGATAVQVGTASFRDPGAAGTIVAELEKLVQTEQLGPLSDIIGTLTPRDTLA